MKLNSVASATDYLVYFTQKLNKLHINEYPELLEYYQRLHHEFLEISESDDPFFVRLKEVFLIEAKFQILLMMIEHIESLDMELSEKELIQMVEEDSTCFYREMTGQRKNASITWSMIYLSEK